MSAKRILVVDDEQKMQRVLEIMLKRIGHDVVCAGDGHEALAALQSGHVDLVVSDLRMPGMGGIELLRALREGGSEVPVIIMTAYGTIETAVEAMKLGASEYIVRPFDVDALELAINRTLAVGQMQRQQAFLRDELEKGWGDFVGQSAAMRQVYEQIRQVAPGRTTVLVTGETGTGKELVAHAIHRASPRQDALFVPINCAAIPADILESELFGYERGAFTGAVKERVGKFELADGGTLFLDELTEMPMALQAKLLRAIQENVIERLGGRQPIPVDIRIVAATNRNPRQAVAEGRLREDLYYRVAVFAIEVPPLRTRPEDIEALVAHFVARFARPGSRPGVSPEAMQVLQSYPWPGNVRELQNVIERALVMSHGGDIGVAHLPADLQPVPRAVQSPQAAGMPASLQLTPAVEQLELEMIREALRRAGNSKAKAARLLDISERSLWYKLKKYGLSS